MDTSHRVAAANPSFVKSPEFPFGGQSGELPSLSFMPTTILHLSDVHRTNDEKVTNDQLLLHLLNDLRHHKSEGLPKPDVVIVSGDISQAAAPEEYNETFRFLSELASELDLGLDRIVVVPGNHDVHWPTFDKTVRWFDSKPSDRDLYVADAAKGFLGLSSAEDYQLRFAHFRAFYERLTGTTYPSAREEQFTIHRWNGLPLTVIGFNSCDINDRFRRSGNIHPSCIHRAIQAIKHDPSPCLAVWHHDYNWRSTPHSDCLDYSSLQLLTQQRFVLGLCGHTHRASHQSAETLTGGLVPIVAAGSLCAGPVERSEMVPRSYNLIVLKADSAVVHVRSKRERDSAWEALPYIRNAEHYTASYSVPIAGEHPTPTPTSLPSPPQVDPPRLVVEVGATRPSTPFHELNAKVTPRETILSDYVWIDQVDALDSAMPHIVLGPRGCGKTALLLTLTLEGRLVTPKYSNYPERVLERIGLLCSMKIQDSSAFNDKGWMDRKERLDLFKAFLATLWSQELILTVERVISHPVFIGARLSAESITELTANLTRLWLAPGSSAATLADLSLSLSTLRTSLIGLLSLTDVEVRKTRSASVLSHPLLRGGASRLHDAAVALGRYRPFEHTCWLVLFDEVDHLNEWQQTAIYEFLASPTPRAGAKVATLPYAHAKVLSTGEPPLVEGSDYHELTLTFPRYSGAEDSAFIRVAEELWRRRIEPFAKASFQIQDAWPEEKYEEVLTATSGRRWTAELLREELISQLSPEAQGRARELAETDPSSFSDQYSRKFQAPFRFRLAQRLDADGSRIPLYWGWRTLLRACEDNCRRFLNLADLCWRRYWATDGLRPMSASEQSLVLLEWAAHQFTVGATFGDVGRELTAIVEDIADELRTRMISGRLTQDSFSVTTRDLAQGQVDAITLGIGHGHLVPRLDYADVALLARYPTKNIELRLGYPMAVHKRIPLRVGEAIKVSNLRQARLPWWKD